MIIEKNISALVLAGGYSRRLGIYKPLTKRSNKYMIEHILDILLRIFNKIHISVKFNSQKELINSVIPTHSKSNIDYIVDEYIIQHPIIGMYSSLKYLRNRYNYVFITACDMLNINDNAITYMISYINDESTDAVIPLWSNGFIEPLFAIYNTKRTFKIINEITTHNLHNLDKISLHYVVKKLSKVTYVSAEYIVERFGNVFRNVNSVNDILNC